MQGMENRKAYFTESISYCEPNKEPVSFVSNTYGTISTEPRDEYGCSFDKIFIPQNQSKILAEFIDDEHWKFWTNDAYLQIKDYLDKK